MVKQATIKPPRALSGSRRAVLGCIVEYVARHGYPPTMREIQGELEISSSSVVAHHLDALQAAGYLRRTPKRSRSIVVEPAAHKALR